MENFELLKRAIKDSNQPINSDTEGQGIHGGILGSDHDNNLPGPTGLEDLGSNSGSNPSPPTGLSNIMFLQGKPISQTTSDSIKAQGMSQLDPIALMTRMRQLGLLVGRIEEAQSKITATMQTDESNIVEQEHALMALEDIQVPESTSIVQSQSLRKSHGKKKGIRWSRSQINSSEFFDLGVGLAEMNSRMTGNRNGPDAMAKGEEGNRWTEIGEPHQDVDDSDFRIRDVAPAPPAQAPETSTARVQAPKTSTRPAQASETFDYPDVPDSIPYGFPSGDSDELPNLSEDNKSYARTTGGDHHAGLELKASAVLDHEVDDLLTTWTTTGTTIESRTP
jgi:hypothetical protein